MNLLMNEKLNIIMRKRYEYLNNKMKKFNFFNFSSFIYFNYEPGTGVIYLISQGFVLVTLAPL